jgi:hypothetical protein
MCIAATPSKSYHVSLEGPTSRMQTSTVNPATDHPTCNFQRLLPTHRPCKSRQLSSPPPIPIPSIASAREFSATSPPTRSYGAKRKLWLCPSPTEYQSCLTYTGTTCFLVVNAHADESAQLADIPTAAAVSSTNADAQAVAGTSITLAPAASAAIKTTPP